MLFVYILEYEENQKDVFCHRMSSAFHPTPPVRKLKDFLEFKKENFHLNKKNAQFSECISVTNFSTKTDVLYGLEYPIFVQKSE